MSAADRARAYRRRRRCGETVLRVVVPSEPLILALLESGRLTEHEALDQHHIEAATGRIIEEWAKHWNYKNRYA